MMEVHKTPHIMTIDVKRMVKNVHEDEICEIQ